MSDATQANKSERETKSGLLPGVWCLVQFLLILAVVFVHYRHNLGFAADDSFITFRYAFNFVNGDGLTFNIYERHYGSTAVGFAILVGIAGGLWCMVDSLVSPSASLDLFSTIPLVAGAISSVSLGVAGWILSRMAWRWFGLFAGSVISLSLVAVLFFEPARNSVAGHETYTYVSLCFVASYLAVCHSRRRWAAGTLVVATCVRPDAMLFAALTFSLLFLQTGLSGAFEQRSCRRSQRGCCMGSLWACGSV